MFAFSDPKLQSQLVRENGETSTKENVEVVPPLVPPSATAASEASLSPPSATSTTTNPAGSYWNTPMAEIEERLSLREPAAAQYAAAEAEAAAKAGVKAPAASEKSAQAGDSAVVCFSSWVFSTDTQPLSVSFSLALLLTLEILDRIGEFSSYFLRQVECLAGDLSLERFGLSEQVYERLCKEVDVIFHNG